MGMKVNAELPLPADLKAEYPMPEKLKEIKKERDQEIRNIFTGESDKFIVLVGLKCYNKVVTEVANKI